MRGNALIYVLLALALLGGLTMLLAKQGSESDDLTYETSELLVTKTVAFAAAAKSAVDQMLMSGTNMNNLSYLRPGMAGFDTAPNHNKIFHPEGGGLTRPAADTALFKPQGGSTTPTPGWYIGRFNNIEWTPSTAQDMILTAYDVNQNICAALNKKITGSSDIPRISSTLSTHFVSVADGSSANADLTKTLCASCDGYPSLCVGSASAPEVYVYYNIISAQ